MALGRIGKQIPVIFLFVATFGWATTGFAQSVNPFASAWASTPELQLRLIWGSSVIDRVGKIHGAIQIQLEPEWHSYWRSPGAVGLAPQFDVTTSTNLSEIKIALPPPNWWDDSPSFGYSGEVLWPLEVKPTDPQQPSVLRVKMKLGVCREICIPLDFELSHPVPGGSAGISPFLDRVRHARNMLPQPFSPQLTLTDVWVLGTKLHATIQGPALGRPMAFVEKLDGQAFGPGVVEMAADRKQATIIVDVPPGSGTEKAMLTLVDGNVAIEKLFDPGAANELGR